MIIKQLLTPEYESVLHPPSVIAAACLLESVNRLLGYEECLEVLRDIVSQTGLHPVRLTL